MRRGGRTKGIGREAFCPASRPLCPADRVHRLWTTAGAQLAKLSYEVSLTVGKLELVRIQDDHQPAQHGHGAVADDQSRSPSLSAEPIASETSRRHLWRVPQCPYTTVQRKTFNKDLHI